MSIVAFMNMKGGVGKTTLCVNLADALAREFKSKVLVVDIDPQFNATQCFMNPKEYMLLKKKEGKTITGIYADQLEFPSLVEGQKTKNLEPQDLNEVICKVGKNLDIIPGDLQLIQIEKPGVGQELRLKRFIERHELADKYDYIFVDCPPTNSIWTRSAIIASNYYVLPVKPDHLSSVGLALFTSVVRQTVDNYACAIDCAGIVFTMVQANTILARETMKSISKSSEYKDKVYSAFIRHSTQIAGSQQRGKFMLDLDGNHSSDIKRIAREFIERID